MVSLIPLGQAATRSLGPRACGVQLSITLAPYLIRISNRTYEEPAGEIRGFLRQAHRAGFNLHANAVSSRGSDKDVER
jgi:ABC-type methionine transport system permease subunit